MRVIFVAQAVSMQRQEGWLYPAFHLTASRY